MYGTTLPSTGVGLTAGAAAFAGYSIVALVLAIAAAGLFGIYLVRMAKT